MSNTDHLAKAKGYIAIAESADSKTEAYRKAAEEIVAAIEQDGYTQAEVAQELGRDRSWVVILLAWKREGGHAHTTPFGGEAKNARTDRGKARKVLREADDSTMQEIVAALPEEQRTKLVHAAVNVPRPESGDREGEREIFKSIEDAPKHDLSAQAAKLVLVASQIELLLADGAEFQRMDAKNLQRLDRDLGRVKDTAERLQEQIGAQSKVRRIA